MFTRTLGLILLGSLAAAAPAAADTLIASAAGARNLASGGDYYAWAAPAADGRWRLTVRAPNGVVSTPSIPDFGAPPDPAIGTRPGTTPDRRLVVVYSRCVGVSAIAGCDVYEYDVVAGTEQKFGPLATTAYSETAPSLALGVWSFVRRGAARAADKGVFVYSERSAERRRLSPTIARETATNGTGSRVAFTYNSSRGGGVSLRRASGDGAGETLTARRETVPSSIVATRYRAAWLEGATAFQTTRFGGSGGPTAPRLVPQIRALPASVNSITTDGARVAYFVDAAGLKKIAPSLFPN